MRLPFKGSVLMEPWGHTEGVTGGHFGVVSVLVLIEGLAFKFLDL